MKERSFPAVGARAGLEKRAEFGGIEKRRKAHKAWEAVVQK